MTSFEPHHEILPLAQQKLWPELRPVTTLGFVLYGGTAVALRLGHRQSIDFDFFSEKNLDKEALQQALPFLNQARLLQDRENSLTVVIPSNKESVKLSFFGGISFGRVGQPELTSDGVLQVASLNDVMATKLKVVFQRVEAKDYFDIAAMIEADISLSEGLAAASLMFGMAFQPSESLKALTYFYGGDLHELTPQIQQTLIKAVNSVHQLPEAQIISSSLSAN